MNGKDEVLSSDNFANMELSDNEDDEEYVEHAGDYSTRMEELLAEDGSDGPDTEADENEDDGFIYTGNDANLSAGYKEQLRDVLGPDHEDESDAEAHEVERSLLIDNTHVEVDNTEDDDEQSPSPPTTPPSASSPTPADTPSRLSRPFLHPNVSRLRSYTPQGSRLPSASSVGTSQSNAFHAASPAPSHFSSVSRMSSVSNLHAPSSTNSDIPPHGKAKLSERDVCKWTELQNIGHHIYSSSSSKASSLLGASFGSPTVLAANGLICIGTDDGKICVYDFKQTLKCVCSNNAAANLVGAVTALALSHDHTYVASGHSTGHIQLFDIKTPHTPARSVPPTTLAVISSGRKEGHVYGSRIVSVGFVAGRHTALVSADEHGLAFYHSLGKVLFVEAPDILRILGKYPLDGPVLPSAAPQAPSHRPDVSLDTPTSPSGTLWKRRSRYTILGMMPLPLGTTSHPTDAYQIVAMLTPSKLVVVGLKPTPKTYFKFSRVNEVDLEFKVKSKRGTLCWFPSVLPGSNPKDDWVKSSRKDDLSIQATDPQLVCSWGRTLHILRVSESRTKQAVRLSRAGKANEMEVGSISFEQIGKWCAGEDILAVQWLNLNQVVVFTATTLQVYDVHHSKIIETVFFDGLSLVSPSLRLTIFGASSYTDSVSDIAHSVRVYKGKIFLLGREHVLVGTFLTWADKILSFVQEGDFLSAINLTRLYYTGEATGNTNGLPDNPDIRKEIVGQKLRELMSASAQYAFSEDRMTDGTHVTSDNRGVDRTSLFEGLVSTCCHACIALHDYEFLFEDLFQQYEDCGISRIFLTQLEKFVLDSEIHYVPPRVTQRLIAMHDEDGRPDLVERVIWHIDAECLDINQAIRLCQTHKLYDALIYVYTRALRDYVAPVVELLGLIRKAHQYRRRPEFRKASASEDAELEPVILNAYKIYPYLANVLSGLTYPSEEPLGEEEASQAKKDIYTFLFFGRSSVWPPGEGGMLVLTADEEGGSEPTYPYIQQLLRFDSESFLHSLDIAFEDTYLNDESQGVNRLVIVRILTEIASTSTNLSSADLTFVNIFIARNVPKYPQFLPVAPSALHNILTGLAEDSHPNTREDRQLAAEYLLSVYTPHDSEHILHLFQDAGFYRILRTWHRHDRKWGPLLSTFLDDPDFTPFELFHNVDEVLDISTRTHQGVLPPELVAFIVDAIPQLVRSNVASTAILLDKHVPTLHDQAIDCLGEDADNERFTYLRYLLGPPDDEEYELLSHNPHPSQKLSSRLRQLYITLQCKLQPEDVIRVLRYLSSDLLDWDNAILTCESNEVYDAVVWALDSQGHPLDALSKADAFEKRLALRVVDIFSNSSATESFDTVKHIVHAIESVGRIGISICMGRSQNSSGTDVPLEDIWFKLLNSQIDCVQTLSSCCSAEALSQEIYANSTDSLVQSQRNTLSALRALVQETFGALVSITTTRAVSFPRLFTRLVNSATQSHKTTGTQYTEFRTILTGMLESYRSDGDMLIITKHLVDRDLFKALAEATEERVRGWAPSRTECSVCRKPLLDRRNTERPSKPSHEDSERQAIVVSRSGLMYHSKCSVID